jgi:Leu/Phe-tRNA-protein transferase
MTTPLLEMSPRELLSHGLGNRGFLSPAPPLSPETSRALGERGVVWWGLRVYVKPTIEEAIRHAAEENLLNQGAYLLGDSTGFREDGETSRNGESATDDWTALVEKGLWLIRDEVPERVDPALVAARFTPAGLKWILASVERGPFIYQEGWFCPKHRGVITYDDVMASSTYKRIRQFMRSRVQQGYTIRFNTNFVGALERVRDQVRRGQMPDSSRYRNPALFQEAVTRFQTGTSFSVEVWDPKQERMAGGLVGYRRHGVYSPNSVFYDVERAEDGTEKARLDFAKMALVGLIDALHDAGIDWLDAGMVTGFTAGIKGKLIPAEEFNRLAQLSSGSAQPFGTTEEGALAA